MVLCKNEPDTTEIWSQFLEAARELSGTASSAVTDCYAPLPQSGKTLAEKFKFQHVNKYEPLVFLCANGAKPKQVARNVHGNKGGLVGYVAKEVTPTLHRISNDKQLANFCTKRKSCVMVYRKDKLTADERLAVEGLMDRNRATSFVAVNSRKLRLSLEPKFQGMDDPVVLMFKKISKPAPPPVPKVEIDLEEDSEPVDVDSLMDSLLDEEDDAPEEDGAQDGAPDLVSGDEDEHGSGPKPGLYAKLYRGSSLDVTSVSEFIEDFLIEEDLEPLPKTPSLKARPKAPKPTPSPSPSPKKERKPREPREQTREERDHQMDADKDAEKDSMKEEFRKTQEKKRKVPESDDLFEAVDEGITAEEVSDDDNYDDDDVMDLD